MLSVFVCSAGVAAPAERAHAAPLPLATTAVAATPVAEPGRTGVTETVASIMERARADDARAAAEGGPRIHRKIELEADRYGLPNDPQALPVASYVAPEFAREQATRGPLVPLAPQTVSTNFLGATLADTGAFPPDTMGAIGPSQYVVAVNGRIRTFNKTTGVADGALNASMDTFFSSVMTPPVASNFTSDPHIRYDRLTGRWFVVIIDVPGGAGSIANRVLLAVSSGPTISSSASFTFFFFQHNTAAPAGDATAFADYPTLGVDANALYIGDNLFSLTTGGFLGCSGFVVQKSSVLGAGPMVVTAFRGLVPTASSDGPYTPQGVDNVDPAATEGYFIGVSNAAFGRLVIRRVSNPGSATPTISANILLSTGVPTTTFPITVPHLGNTGGTNGNLDGLDDRLFAAHIRNGRLWTAHNIQVDATGAASASGGRNGTRWYEIQNLTGTPAIVQAGTLFDSAASNPTSYFIPSVMVSGQGHAAFSFTNAGAAARINAGTVGRLSSDSLTTLQAPALYTASSTAYNPASDPGGASGRRWGDYSYVSLDPTDDMTMWSIAEYNDAANTYGVRIAKLLAPPPATPASASASITQGASNVNVTITGTVVSGSGFYDPGTNPAGNAFNHIAASVSGTGVTVNSVTYTSPTSITLNLSATAGATTGTRNVTVTNPDGQSTTGNNILTVVAASSNTAPVLDATKSPALTAELEDAGAPSGAVGTLVSALADLTTPAGGLDNIADPDAGALAGVAITAADTTNGSWFYSTNGGTVWTALGAVADANARLLAADANTRVYFQPNANFNGTLATALTFRAWDQTSGTNGSLASAAANGGTTAFSTATDTASLVVTAVNDAPTATNLSAAETYTEDTALNLVDIVASDIDSASVTATLTLSTPANGSLSTATSGAVTSTYNAGTGVWTASGAIADVNVLLAGVTFTPAANVNANFSMTTSISDGALSATGSKAFTGTAVNDAPVLDASKSPALAAVAEDAGAPAGAVGTLVSSLVDSTTPAGGLDNVTDVDAGAQLGVAVVAADTTNGSWLFSIDGGTSWTALGAVTSASARLLAANASTRVYFQPAANFNGSIASALTIRAWDVTSGTNGGTADTSTNGGATAFSSATDTASITVTAVNDAPTATNLSAGETYTEDTALNLVDIVASDIDNASVTATLTLSNPSAGSLNTATSGAVTSTYTAGTGVWTASGAIANVNVLLAGLTFTPAANFNAAFTIATSISDGALSATGTKSMTGIAVNDAPTATNLSAAETYTEDTPLNLVDIVASDVDGGSLTATLTLSTPGAGSLSTGTSGAVTSTYNAGTGTWTASGAIADVNVLLAGVTFTPVANGNSSLTIATSISDGVAAAVTGTKSLTGTAVNDAPTATNLSTAEAYTEDTPLNLVDIVASDIDSATVTATLTLSNPSAGALTTGTSGAVTSTFAAGVWTASGAIADVNALLAGVTFVPAANFNGSFTITTSISDGALSATGSKSVTGIAVNDAPTATNLSAAETYTEDTALNLVDIVASDVDSANVTVTLTLSSPSVGALSTSTSGAVTSTFTPATGLWTASGALADVNAVLAAVTFTPAPNFNGAFTIATAVSDGIAPPASGTKAFTGIPVNDAPTLDAIANPAPLYVGAGLQTVNLAGIGSVEGGQTLVVTATSDTPGLIPNPTVSYTSPNATGSLSFTPVAAQTGTATITVTVQDNGGTANGGADTFTRTFTVTVLVDDVFKDGFE